MLLLLLLEGAVGAPRERERSIEAEIPERETFMTYMREGGG